MTHATPISLAALCLAAVPAAALDLAWPEEAELASVEPPTLGTFELATGPYASDTIETITAEGAVEHQIWHVPGQSGDPVALLTTLRDQLSQQGYDIGFTCTSLSCGGFDFRYSVPIADTSAMHVDLGNFHYLTASPTSEDGGTTNIALTVSHGGQLGYAHLAVVTPPGDLAPDVTPSTRALEQEIILDSVQEALITHGRAALDDLVFETGASSLSGRRYESLVDLAAFLSENPTRSAVLVGHTDAEGSLEANITLSRARANAVRQFLIDELGIPPAQISAEGVGFLAPRASNDSDEGRQSNRRVEVVLADPG